MFFYITLAGSKFASGTLPQCVYKRFSTPLLVPERCIVSEGLKIITIRRILFEYSLSLKFNNITQRSGGGVKLTNM